METKENIVLCKLKSPAKCDYQAVLLRGIPARCSTSFGKHGLMDKCAYAKKAELIIKE